MGNSLFERLYDIYHKHYRVCIDSCEDVFEYIFNGLVIASFTTWMNVNVHDA